MRYTTSTVVALTVPLASAFPPPRHQPADGTYGVLTEASQVTNKSFDYIICGGGLTGLTVANRLSEDPRMTVLVIENGQDNHNDPRVYDVRTYGEAFATDLDYNLTSTPVASQNDTGLLLVAGRTLGGSGSINGASWTKGAESQYNLLPGLTGDESWGFGSLNELMLKSENFHEPTKAQVAKGARFQRGYHGRHGEVEVSFAAGLFGSIQQPALQASQKVWSGLQRLSDLAAGVVTGASIIPNMLHAEESQNRSSPFTAHAQWQVQQRDNLMILTGHRVTSIKWRPGKEMVAEGVTFQACRDCEELTTDVKGEVLLAAGSLQSPQLLELSGVGDPEVLAAAGVPLRMASRGVGKNMQEQTKNSVMLDPKFTDFEGSGPPAAIAFPNVDQLFGGNSSQIYEEVMSGLSDYSQQLEADGLVANGTAALAILQSQVNNLWQDKAAASEVFFTLTPSSNQVGIDLWNLIVLSRGYVHIKSNSSWDHPIIEPSYFGHPFDLKVQTATAMQSREVYQTEPLASYVANETYPGLAVPRNASAQVWEQWVQQTFTSVWHYIATLSMMKEELGGVVDSRLKVYGIKNVRAVDASVLPIQLSAHLSSSLYGIAEKAAVMISEDQREATRGLGWHGGHDGMSSA